MTRQKPDLMQAPVGNALFFAMRAGEVTVADFVRNKSGKAYLRRMVGFYAAKIPWSAPIDASDLRQLALLELDVAPRLYHFRCPACPRIAESADDFTFHARRHPTLKLQPKPSMFEFVHGRVGRALDHEVRFHDRRKKWWLDLDTCPAALRARAVYRPESEPDGDVFDLFAARSVDNPRTAPPGALIGAEHSAELAKLIGRAEAEQNGQRRRLLEAMALDLTHAESGIVPERSEVTFRRLKARLRCDWLAPRTA